MVDAWKTAGDCWASSTASAGTWRVEAAGAPTRSGSRPSRCSPAQSRLGLRPVPRGPPAPGPLRSPPLGPELLAGPPAGRGGVVRHHHRRLGPLALGAVLQLGRP